MARLSLRGLRWKCESQARLPHTTLLMADEARSYLIRQFGTAGRVACGTWADHRPRPAIGTADTMAFRGPTVRGRPPLGQCRAPEEARGALPSGRPGAGGPLGGP